MFCNNLNERCSWKRRRKQSVYYYLMIALMAAKMAANFDTEKINLFLIVCRRSLLRTDEQEAERCS